MGLADDRHGAELLTPTGKVYPFDSAECLADWVMNDADAAEIHSAWVTDFSNPGTLIRADQAYFLASPTLQSPMGLGLSAFAREEDRDGAVISFGGEALDWEGAKAYVAERWSGGSHGGMMPGGTAHGAHGAQGT